MDAKTNTDNLAETLVRELRKTTSNVFLGFPPPDELGTIRKQFQTVRAERRVQLEQEREASFQELKRAALANMRKDQT